MFLSVNCALARVYMCMFYVYLDVPGCIYVYALCLQGAEGGIRSPEAGFKKRSEF